MPEWIVQPQYAFGPIRLGMTRQDIVGALGEPESDFGDTIGYSTLGIRIELKNGTCDSVESALQVVTPIVAGIPMEGSFEEAVTTLRERGFQVEEGTGANVGTTSFPELGVYLWRDDDEEDTIDAIGLYRTG